MQTFFHGWRRKAGIVALGLACVFAGGWIRSEMVDEAIHVCGLWIYAGDGDFAVGTGSVFLTGDIVKTPTAIAGFPFDRLFSFKYGWFVIPLTLLSSYLLLWKPRKR